MSEQTRKARKPKPESLFEGDGVEYTLNGGTVVRTGKIVLKDGAWCCVDLFDDHKTVWIKLKPGH